MIVRVEVRGFNLVIVADASGALQLEQDVWLKVVPFVAVQRGHLVKDNMAQALVFKEFCRVFQVVDLTISSFLTVWRGIRQRKNFAVVIVSVAVVESLLSKAPDVVAIARAARKEGAVEMANAIVKIRDSNTLVMRSIVKSDHASQALNRLYMREKSDGTRTRIRVQGVPVPKVFSPPSQVAKAVNALVDESLSFYKENSELKWQFAALGDVFGKIIKESSCRDVLRGSVFPVLVIDHLDAISVTARSKRTPCTLRLFSPVLFGGASSSAVWFDFEGGVQRICEFAAWRVSEYNGVVGKITLCEGYKLRVVGIWIVGDNERLQIEQGGCTGSSVCRCALCTLPQQLFCLLPRAGLTRTTLAGAHLFHANELACKRVEYLNNLVKMNAQAQSSLTAHIKAMSGSTNRLPLLAEGASFDLNCIHLSPAVLHDVAQVLLDVKVFLNTKLPAEAKLEAKEYLPCSERRLEMSKWRDVYSPLTDEWYFVPDLAAQMTGTLWRSNAATFQDAVRAQVCGLVLFFVLGSDSLEDCHGNYLHGLAAHLLSFLCSMAELDAKAVDFFEEAGERGTCILRNFVRDKSNFRDNLFLGARVAEEVAKLLKTNRERRFKCSAAVYSDVFVAPCVCNGVAVHLETLRTFVFEIAASDKMCKFVSVDGDCLLFRLHEGIVAEVTVVCICGEHVPSGQDVPVLDLAKLSDDHWLHSGRHISSKKIAQLDSLTYDSLSAMVANPLNLELPFRLSDSLIEMLSEMPKSALLTKMLKKTLADLKKDCRDHGLATSGGKEELASRIVGRICEKRDAELSRAIGAEDEAEEIVAGVAAVVDNAVVSTESVGPYAKLTKHQLQEKCRERKLKVTGTKNTLIESLVSSDLAGRNDVDEEEIDGMMILAVEMERGLIAPRARRQRREVDEDDDYIEEEENNTVGLAATRSKRKK